MWCGAAEVWGGSGSREGERGRKGGKEGGEACSARRAVPAGDTQEGSLYRAEEYIMCVLTLRFNLRDVFKNNQYSFIV